MQLTTSEVENQKKFWFKREQQQVKGIEKFEIDQKGLDLQKNEEDIYICKGIIVGVHSMFLHYECVSRESCSRSTQRYYT